MTTGEAGTLPAGAYGMGPGAVARHETRLDRADHGEIRRNNLELVLRHVRARRDSRAGIAGRTGLTRATVSRLVSELIASGLIREDGRQVVRTNGRPGTALVLDGCHVFGVGAEINVDHLSVLVADLSGRVVYERRDAFDPRAAGPGPTITALARLCTSAIEAAVASLPPGTCQRRQGPPFVAGVVVGVAGIVDVRQGATVYAPNLGWRDVPIVGPLRDHLGWDPARTVGIGNDADLAAVAEVRCGEYAGASDIVYIEGGVGIGGGIIASGLPLLGWRGHGGEVGHTVLSADGPLCGCGRRGCWEAYIGLNALLRASGLVDDATHESAPVDENVTRLEQAAARGDVRTIAALEQAGTWLGIGAANLANVLNPQAVIVGGYIAVLARWLMPNARIAYGNRAFGPARQVGDLAVSTLGLGAVTRGGASQLIEQIFRDPTQLSTPSSR